MNKQAHFSHREDPKSLYSCRVWSLCRAHPGGQWRKCKVFGYRYHWHQQKQTNSGRELRPGRTRCAKAEVP